MRSLFAGLVLLLVTGSTALAQAKGEVEAIGFGNDFRPECWTAMVVKLWPQTSNTGTYLIQVMQEDLDRDRVLYERKVTLTGNSEGQGIREQRFWMYFIPEPNPKGVLAEQNSMAGLTAHLKVFLCTVGGKQLQQLPVTTTIKAVDDMPSSRHRGHRIVLMVADADSGASSVRPDYETMPGVLEDAVMIPVRPADLPENILGYEAVDAIVMLNVDPANLKIPTDERMKAVKEYVRQGGNLVLCQTSQWEKMIGWGDLLGVTFPRYGTEDAGIQGVADRADLKPLSDWAAGWKNETSDTKSERERQWKSPKGPFKVGLVEPKPGTMVENWIGWPKEAGLGDNFSSPYLARWVYGAGGVTYVAQDLGNSAITGVARMGWENIWDHIFGWKSFIVPRAAIDALDTEALTKFKANAEAFSTEGTPIVDLGRPLLMGMEHGERGAALMSLAILFFIVYWVAAAPVSYFVLAGKGKASLSWFVFAASAIVATLLTALVVKAALSGSPQVKHVTVVRMVKGQPAVAWSRIGLYIPRDGPQTIELKDTATDSVSYVAPYAMHPTYTQENEFPAYMEYEVPIQDANSGTAPSVAVPYRRTLKKMEAKWVGNLGAGIEGVPDVKQVDTVWRISGQLTNGTGHDLRNIYLAWRYPDSVSDQVMYLPDLGKSETINLANLADYSKAALPLGEQGHAGTPESIKRRDDRSLVSILDRIGTSSDVGWNDYWTHSLRHRSNIGMAEENTSAMQYNDAVPRWFPMLSLFDRLPPVKLDSTENGRVDLLRRGARNLDLSATEMAGGLVILAETDGTPLPFPFVVDGEAVGGEGKTFYQFVLPMTRASNKPATTQEISQ